VTSQATNPVRQFCGGCKAFNSLGIWAYELNLNSIDYERPSGDLTLRIFQKRLPVQIAGEQQIASQLPRSIIPLYEFIPPLTNGVIYSRCRFRLTKMTHQSLEPLHQVQAWKLGDDSVVFVPGQKIAFNAVGTLKVGPDAVGYRLDLRFFVEDDGAGRVESDCVPDKSVVDLV
jgi:hypothetical protein